MLGFMMPKGTFKYLMMPQVFPRLSGLFLGGFRIIPFLIAAVYQMVGLLPRNHPYMDQGNAGRFGIRHVVAEAANNLRFEWRNIDQIVLFAAVLIGLVIFILQFVALGAMVFMQPVAAMPTNWTGFFTLSDVESRHDLAYMMLDLVFGVPVDSTVANSPGLFQSCVSTNEVCHTVNSQGAPTDIEDTTLVIPGLDATRLGPLSSGSWNNFPFAYHVGLHRLLSIYSTGLLTVAVFVASYFIATILAETAQSGTPFGRRFNKTWAPLRIVMAFGLLIPFGVGLNSSQYIVLYAAKYGSAFATNGWAFFNQTLTTTYTGQAQNLISAPYPPEIDELLQFLHVSKTCAYITNHYNQERENLEAREEYYRNNPGGTNPPTAPALAVGDQVWPYILRPQNTTGVLTSLAIQGVPAFNLTSNTQYAAALGFINVAGVSTEAKHIVIRFGIQDEEKYPTHHGFVSPTCGEVVIPLTDNRPQADALPATWAMQRTYYNLIMSTWYPTTGSMFNQAGAGTNIAQTAATGFRHREVANRLVASLARDTVHNFGLDSTYVNNVRNATRTGLQTAITDAVNAQRAATNYDVPAALLEKGWAGAGIWYNYVSELNGSVTASVAAVPVVKAYPEVMEAVGVIRQRYEEDVAPGQRFRPRASSIDSIAKQLGKEGQEYATTLWNAYAEWGTAAGDSVSSSSVFAVLVKEMFGLSGLYNLRENPDTHPLAMLSGIGRSLVESAVRNVGYAGMLSIVSLIPEKTTKKTAGMLASFLVTIATLGLTVGIVLFYIIPFLPFIYFFFAVGGWIKGIFEALVGAPLWALAHIRIDGNGLPGQAALNGYFLIFEVFLRPILIIFGLLASVSTYSALVSVLNNIFSLVAESAAGYDIDTELSLAGAADSMKYLRSVIDQFFFTIIYAILVYMMGMASFKLIDTIPNNILRWMGQSVATFGDQRENPAEALVSRAYTGSQQAVSKVGGGLQAVTSAAQKATKAT